MAVNVAGQCHIGEHRHPRKKLNILKCSADTHVNKLVSVKTAWWGESSGCETEHEGAHSIQRSKMNQKKENQRMCGSEGRE